MKKINIALFAAILLISASSIFGQPQSLSEAEYNRSLAKALDAASTRYRRILTEETFYDGARVTGTRKIVSDFAGPDAKKIEVSEELNGKRTRSDSVKIADQIFCRDGNKSWKKSVKDCTKVGMMAIPDGDYEYSVETDARDSTRKMYTRRASFEDAGLPEREAVRLRFIEIKFVADETGILEYTETRRGGAEPNGWSSTQVTRYEYEPANLKISDPTRVN